MRGLSLIWVCSTCGSKDVQEKAWVDINNDVNPKVDFINSGNMEDYWCKDCSEHTKIITQEQYFIRNKLEIE